MDKKELLEKELLDELKNFAKLNEEEIQEKLKTFPTFLFENFQIEKVDEVGDVNKKKVVKRYDFVEIEFYIYNKDHKDCITYERDCQAGYWFFHFSGVDISFEGKLENKQKNSKSEDENNYGGGILIRSIRDNEGHVFCGPHNCEYELFDKFNAFGKAENAPRIVAVERNKKDKNNFDIQSCPRCIKANGKTREDKCTDWMYKDVAQMIKFLSKKYRFYDHKNTKWKSYDAANDGYKDYGSTPSLKYKPQGFDITDKDIDDNNAQ